MHIVYYKNIINILKTIYSNSHASQYREQEKKSRRKKINRMRIGNEEFKCQRKAHFLQKYAAETPEDDGMATHVDKINRYKFNYF